MSLPTPTKTWVFSLNNRTSWSTANAVMSNVLYGAKNFAIATVGLTLKYTCNGTTGPTSTSDHTDRLTSASTFATRGANATTAQSFAVWTDANGVDVILAYQGTSDDVAMLMFAPNGDVVPAGTANQQPIATSGVLVTATPAGTSLIGTDTSHDRVYNYFASNDKKMFRMVVYCNSVMESFFGVEQLTSLVASPATFSPSVVGFLYTVNGSSGSWPFGATDSTTHVESGYVHTSANFTVVCGTSMSGYNAFNVNNPWAVDKPELQGGNGELILPVNLATTTVGAEGFLGTKIDMWYVYTSSASVPALGDTYGTLQFVAVNGPLIMPWDGATTPQIT